MCEILHSVSLFICHFKTQKTLFSKSFFIYENNFESETFYNVSNECIILCGERTSGKISSTNSENLRLHNHALAVNFTVFTARSTINNPQNEQKHRESFNEVHDDERIFSSSTN